MQASALKELQVSYWVCDMVAESLPGVTQIPVPELWKSKTEEGAVMFLG